MLYLDLELQFVHSWQANGSGVWVVVRTILVARSPVLSYWLVLLSCWKGPSLIERPICTSPSWRGSISAKSGICSSEWIIPRHKHPIFE